MTTTAMTTLKPGTTVTVVTDGPVRESTFGKPYQFVRYALSAIEQLEGLMDLPKGHEGFFDGEEVKVEILPPGNTRKDFKCAPYKESAPKQQTAKKPPVAAEPRPEPGNGYGEKPYEGKFILPRDGYAQRWMERYSVHERSQRLEDMFRAMGEASD